MTVRGAFAVSDVSFAIAYAVTVGGAFAVVDVSFVVGYMIAGDAFVMGDVIAGDAFVMAVGNMILLYKAPVVDIIVGGEVAEGDLMVGCGVAVRGVILRAGLDAVNVVQTAYNAV
jgi:hypothetical protein